MNVKKVTGYGGRVIGEGLPLSTFANKSAKGFTLLEMIIYIGLFGILMGGAFISAYSVMEGNGRTQNKSIMQQEGDFLVAKINWAMSSAQYVNAPAVGAAGSTFSVTRWDTSSGNPIVISITGTDMTLSRSGGPAQILNTDDVQVSNLTFTHEYLGGSNPESVKASFTLSSKTPNGMPISGEFSTTNYVRK